MRIEKRVIRNIRKLRELRLMSREQMAAELSLSISGYGRLERGEIDLTLSRMKRIADILNVNLNELLDFEPTTVLQKKPNLEKREVLAEDERNQYYRERYILMLESELDRLRQEVRELRKQKIEQNHL
jgi:transcriptional regulator with XRE-family HTH domain